MNRKCHKASNAFTLVELLVVIAILGIVMAILLPTIVSGIRKAEIARAQQEMGAISAAIQSYLREYGIMPAGDTNGNPDHLFVGKEGLPNDNPIQHRRVMGILRALDSTNNPRRTVFLEVPESSMEGNDRLGNAYVVDDGYYLDPWGNPYMIVMDTDFDNTIGGFHNIMGSLSGLGALPAVIVNMSPTKSGSFPGVQVGVMSLGPTPGATNSFLKSW